MLRLKILSLFTVPEFVFKDLDFFFVLYSVSPSATMFTQSEMGKSSSG